MCIRNGGTVSTVTREQWLILALGAIRERMAQTTELRLPDDVRVSVGFPGGGSARKRIGECWPRSRSASGVNEIFISPVLTDLPKLLEVLVHEAVHAADDCASGHKAAFKRAALGIGLVGKMTATTAGEQLAAWITVTVTGLPAIEYGALSLAGRKVQSTRMIKCECQTCGYTCRTATKWIDTVGAPICPCNGDQMAVA